MLTLQISEVEACYSALRNTLDVICEMRYCARTICQGLDVHYAALSMRGTLRELRCYRAQDGQRSCEDHPESGERVIDDQCDPVETALP
jgi:hypothetical protein